MTPVQTVSHHQALIYAMVTMSAVDARIGDRELRRIGQIVQTLPVFKGFDPEQLTRVAQECGEILQVEDGLEAVLGLGFAIRTYAEHAEATRRHLGLAREGSPAGAPAVPRQARRA